MAKLRESELCVKILNQFPEADIYKEVATSHGVTDIVLRHGEILTGIEVKTSCSMALMEQAWQNTQNYHYSYIAFPGASLSFTLCPTRFQRKICNMLGIGMFRWDTSSNSMSELLAPRLNRRVVVPPLFTWQKESVAGSVSDRMTPFKASVDSIKRLLRFTRGRSLLLKELFHKDRHYHWASFSTARSCFLNYVARGIITEIEVRNGRVFLTEGGRTYAERFKDLVKRKG